MNKHSVFDKEEKGMGKSTSNLGNVNTQAVINSITLNGGGVTSRVLSDGTIHTSVYSKTENRRISWDEKNGQITDVHSTKGNKHIDYKGGR